MAIPTPGQVEFTPEEEAQQKLAGNIPAVPAGPGGDKPGDPFGKPAPIPPGQTPANFGKRMSDAGSDDADA